MLKLKKLAILSFATICLASPVLADGGYVEGDIDILPTPISFGVKAGYSGTLAENLGYGASFGIKYPLGGSVSASGGAGLYYSLPILSGPNYGLSFVPSAELWLQVAPSFDASVSLKPQLTGYYNLGPGAYAYGGAYWTLVSVGTSGFTGPIDGRRAIYAGANLTNGALTVNPELGFYFPNGMTVDASLGLSYAIADNFTVGARTGYEGNVFFGTGGIKLGIFGRYSF